MNAGGETQRFWLYAKSLFAWPRWWARLMLCVAAVSLMLLVLCISDSDRLVGPASVFGAVFLVLFVLLVGPPAARPRTDSFSLSRPGGRAEAVNRRALLMTGVALCCCLFIGLFAFAAKPTLFRRHEVDLSFWFMADVDPFIGVELSPRSEEERICLNKWSSLRRGGSPACNDLARAVFSGTSSPDKRFIFATANERDCLAQWAEHESAKAQFAGIFAEKPWENPEDDRNWVVTGVSKYSVHGDSWGKAALAASASPACAAFALELADDTSPFQLLVADEPKAQPCFAHWQEALGRTPACWNPPGPARVTLPPVGLVLIACFGLALVAGATARTALAPAGPGRTLTLVGTGLAMAAPVASVLGARSVSAGVVVGCTALLAVGAYVAARARWAKGDFK